MLALCYWTSPLWFVPCVIFFFFKQKTAYELLISDWSSDVCSSDLVSLYRADLKGELLQYNVVAGLYPAATFNAGRTRHQGIEAGLDLKLTPWASLRQVYQYSDFRFRDDAPFGDNRLPVVPRHFYRAELKVGTERQNGRAAWRGRGGL